MPPWKLSSGCCSKELLAENCLGTCAGPSSVQEHTPPKITTCYSNKKDVGLWHY